MPYAEGRLFYDADSHLMETPEWLAEHAPFRRRNQDERPGSGAM
jgi:hypothetical protein